MASQHILTPDPLSIFSAFDHHYEDFIMDPVYSYHAKSPQLYTPLTSTSAAIHAINTPYADEPQPATSTYSPTSSTIGSPRSTTTNQLPYESYRERNREYTFQAALMDDYATDFSGAEAADFVDPTIFHSPYSTAPNSATMPSYDLSIYPTPYFAASPPLSQISGSPLPIRQGSQSPYFASTYPYSFLAHHPPLASPQSCSSPDEFSGEESREKGRCTYPECGKVFKDLKAHILTHQTERPEKCPIQTCEYHFRGFARKYDKNRHTLTHYKGTMVCGFCPGSGSAAEKSFNRADVFKRHLTSVHAVEQTPPNSRKKMSSGHGGNQAPKLSAYAADATGRCSTCSGIFSNAQDFYEHLDDCVLRIVQQEEPSEAINAARLAEVDQDEDVQQTLRNNAVLDSTGVGSPEEDDNHFNEDDEDEFNEENNDHNEFSVRSKPSRKRCPKNPINGVQKFRGMTQSKGGVTLHTKGRKKRKDYPSSWGCPTAQMKMKKRVLCVFDGSRRLWKDDMMLDTDYEVRVKLSNERAYVTDLDVQTMRRAEAFHNATDDEKGPWISDDLNGMDLEKLMEVKHEAGNGM